MNRKTTLLLVLFILFFTNAIIAQKLVFSYDSSGNQTLQKYCPTNSCPTSLKMQLDSIPITEDVSEIAEEKETKQDQKSSLVLYPNPTTGWVGITFTGQARQQISNLSVFDLGGKLIINQTGNDASLDLSQNPPGLYIARFTMNDGSIIDKKIIKK